jgi:hypothetical protein
MAFSAKQIRALKRNPDRRYLKTRQADGRELTYLEGWYAISEANRIFGFDGWSRETTESRCVLARENRGLFIAVYIARVRLTVIADGVTLIREGHGTGDGHGHSPGEVHDIALKAAETDATKRALATFGRPFGLELYRSGKAAAPKASNNETPLSAPAPSSQVAPRLGFHPDDTTPIPRPSQYYGRPRNEITEHFRRERQQVQKADERRQTQPEPQAAALTARAPTLVPSQSGKIDKSELPIGEPKRLRDKAHLRYVASQPCLICGRQPCDPHHVRFAQPRAIGLKVSDEFTVPLCRTHHRQLHQVGNEQTWWAERNIKPLEIAKTLWQQTRPKNTQADLQQATGDTAAE